jgi:hypothetical protein
LRWLAQDSPTLSAVFRPLVYRFRAAELFLEAIESLMFDLSLHYCSPEPRETISGHCSPKIMR